MRVYDIDEVVRDAEVHGEVTEVCVYGSVIHPHTYNNMEPSQCEILGIYIYIYMGLLVSLPVLQLRVSCKNCR